MGTISPQTIGSYEIVAEIARDEETITFQARQPALNRLVALRVLQSHVAQEQHAVERFMSQARAAANLNHDHILKVYELSPSNPYYIAMKLVRGESLAAVIEREGALEPGYAAEILRQVAGALDYARVRGFFYQKIEPSNILIEQDTGYAILASLELASAAKSEQPPDAQQLLAVLAYQMLTGRLALPTGTVPQLGEQWYRISPYLRELNPADLAKIQYILENALARERGAQVARASDFAEQFSKPLDQATRATVVIRRRDRPTAGQIALIVFAVGGIATCILISFWMYMAGKTDAQDAMAGTSTLVASNVVAANATATPLATLAHTATLVGETSQPTLTPVVVPPTSTLMPFATDLPTATSLPTFTLTATNVPPTIPLPTRTRQAPQPTTVPASSSTIPYPAPVLVAPNTGTVFHKREDEIRLVWQWQGTLGASEVFNVLVMGPPPSFRLVCKFQTREKQIVLPPETAPPCHGDDWEFNDLGTFFWRVYIVDKNSNDPSVHASPDSETWEFEWKY